MSQSSETLITVITNTVELLEKFISEGKDYDLILVRRVEALGRKMRRRADSTTNQIRKSKGRYGALCDANRKQYSDDVNFMYWNTTNSIRRIAKHLGISEPTVNNLIRARPADAKGLPPQTKRHGSE